MESETDLFGNPVASLTRPSTADLPINNVELIRRVLRTAMTEQFVLVGTHERVFRRTTGEYVEPASRAEDTAVHQLIEAKWLQVGGHHTVRYDRYVGSARSVLVPRTTRATAARWGALQCPPDWNQGSTTKSA